MQNFLISCKTPYDIGQELESKSAFGTKYKDTLKKYNVLLEEAKTVAGDKLLFYNYSGQMSISSDLSNELSYLFPKHYICVTYSAGPMTNVSLRGDNVQKILAEILPLIGKATGGGHKDAVGARINTEDLDKFRNALMDRVK